jgi:methionine-rich copper-binding protein CopC
MHRSLTAIVALTALALTAVTVPAVALAHAEFVSSTPADGERLDAPPAEIVVTFEGELQPDGSSFVVTGPSGDVGSGSVDLQVAERNVLRGEMSSGAAGVYTVKWTIVAEDGDQQTGDFMFAIGEAIPETAIPGTAGPMRIVLTLTGLVVLLAVPAVIVRRRLVV